MPQVGEVFWQVGRPLVGSKMQENPEQHSALVMHALPAAVHVGVATWQVGGRVPVAMHARPAQHSPLIMQALPAGLQVGFGGWQVGG
jgi:hypothetical protein